MNRIIRTSLVLLAGLSIAGCVKPEPSANVKITHDCTATECEVLVEIRNPGNDSFKVEYEFEAFDRDSKLLAELDESMEIEGRLSWSHHYVIPVAAKPMMIGAGSSVTRVRT